MGVYNVLLLNKTIAGFFLLSFETTRLHYNKNYCRQSLVIQNTHSHISHVIDKSRKISSKIYDFLTNNEDKLMNERKSEL